MRPPIVLLTDYGVQDPYAGVLHGVLACCAPEHPVIDLTHGVSPQNIRQAAFYLEDAYRYFPKGSLFVCVVDPGVGTKRDILCVKSQSYYFFAPDNGLLTPILRTKPRPEVRRLTHLKSPFGEVSRTFHGRDLIAPAAAATARKPSAFKTLGPAAHHPILFKTPLCVRVKKGLLGEVIYFDHFGNAITSLKRQDAAAGFWKNAKVFAETKKLGSIVKTYGRQKSPVALWNSSNRLEIAVPQGKASSFLNLGTHIRVIHEK